MDKITACVNLAAAATAAGITATVGDGSKLIISGEDLTGTIDIRETMDRSRGRFGSRPFSPRRYQVWIRDRGSRRGERQVVPCRKGVYKWSEAVQLLAAIAAGRRAERQRSQQSSDNRPLAEALRAELGIHEYSNFRLSASASPTAPVTLVIEHRLYLTVEQARAIVAAAREAGVKID